MEKPWDCLRKAKEKPPIEDGHWTTSYPNATVHVRFTGGHKAALQINDQIMGPAALRELAEFCTELANQLDK